MNTAENNNRLSACEELVMKIVWDNNGIISAIEIINTINKKYNRDYARTTVFTFIQRMKDKGYVEIHRQGRYSYVKALKDRKEYMLEVLQNTADFWFDGSLDDMADFIKNR